MRGYFQQKLSAFMVLEIFVVYTFRMFMIQFFSQLTIRFEHYQSHTSLILVYSSQFEELFSYPDSKRSFLETITYRL